MRVVLRDMASKQYFAGKGVWAAEAKRAFDFSDDERGDRAFRGGRA
jgi:hypothetical protein